MDLNVFDDKVTLGKAAAEQAARAIRNAIHERGQARIIAATAASQLEFLAGHLRRLPVRCLGKGSPLLVQPLEFGDGVS